MFSKNNKISKRQTFRLLTYDLLGIGTLLLPTALARGAGKNAILSVLLGTAAGVCFCLLLGWVIESMGEGERYPDYLKRSMGKLFGTAALLYYILYYLCLGGFSSYVFGHLIVANLLKEQSFYWIVAGILALAVYGIFQGMEGRARVYEILFWFLVLPLGLMLFLAARDVEAPRLFPLYETDAAGLAWGSYLTFGVFSLSGFSLFLVPFAREKKKIRSACLWATLLCGALMLALQAILQGMFGGAALAMLEYPVITLMSMIQIPGGFLQRQDALMVGIWFFTIFALISSSMFYASENLNELCARKKGSWCIALAALAMFGIAVFSYRSAEFAGMLLELFLKVATPLAVGIPILARLCVLFRRKSRQLAHCAVFLCSLLFLSGCSTMELENRNFPLAMGVDREDGSCRISYKFQNLAAVANENADSSASTDFYIEDSDFFTGISKYANDTNKILDYNHMKALVLSEDFIEDENALEQFLQVCQKKDLIARNTLLFLAEDAGKILALDENVDAAIGSYLEELIESREDYKLKDAATLGDLYNDRANQEQLLLVPVLAEEGNLPVIRNYYAISGGVPKGEISIHEATLSHLCQGKLKKLSFTLDDGTPVTLERIVVRGSFSRGSDICYHDTLHLEAVIEKNYDEQGVESERYEAEIERMLREQLSRAWKNLRDAPVIDITNSFYRLGMCSREECEKFQGNLQDYIKNMQTEFEVDVVLLN